MVTHLFSGKMDAYKTWIVIFLVLGPVISDAWRSSAEDLRDFQYPQEMRRGVHYHTKRHMLPPGAEIRMRTTTVKPREMRKKPSGHLIPLQDDEMENGEVVSVAIGPPMRPKFEKLHRKYNSKPIKQEPPNSTAVDLVRDVLTELTKQFLTRDVNENFVFGQYVGNAMKNLTSNHRLSMQHEILELIVKYQTMNREGDKKEVKEGIQPLGVLKDNKIGRMEKKSNDTEETWPDFSNLANIVG